MLMLMLAVMLVVPEVRGQLVLDVTLGRVRCATVLQDLSRGSEDWDAETQWRAQYPRHVEGRRIPAVTMGWVRSSMVMSLARFAAAAVSVLGACGREAWTAGLVFRQTSRRGARETQREGLLRWTCIHVALFEIVVALKVSNCTAQTASSWRRER
jgi:hypothetical protein